MTDELARDVAPDDVPRCTWCSAELPSPEATVCPSCGATLVGEGDPQLPGVTALDTEAIIKAARSSSQRPRSRLLSWISGEYEDAPAQRARQPDPRRLRPGPRPCRRRPPLTSPTEGRDGERCGHAPIAVLGYGTSPEGAFPTRRCR